MSVPLTRSHTHIDIPDIRDEFQEMTECTGIGPAEEKEEEEERRKDKMKKEKEKEMNW